MVVIYYNIVVILCDKQFKTTVSHLTDMYLLHNDCYDC